MKAPRQNTFEGILGAEAFTDCTDTVARLHSWAAQVWPDLVVGTNGYLNVEPPSVEIIDSLHGGAYCDVEARPMSIVIPIGMVVRSLLFARLINSHAMTNATPANGRLSISPSLEALFCNNYGFDDLMRLWDGCGDVSHLGDAAIDIARNVAAFSYLHELAHIALCHFRLRRDFDALPASVLAAARDSRRRRLYEQGQRMEMTRASIRRLPFGLPHVDAKGNTACREHEANLSALIAAHQVIVADDVDVPEGWDANALKRGMEYHADAWAYCTIWELGHKNVDDLQGAFVGGFLAMCFSASSSSLRVHEADAGNYPNAARRLRMAFSESLRRATLSSRDWTNVFSATTSWLACGLSELCRRSPGAPEEFREWAAVLGPQGSYFEQGALMAETLAIDESLFCCELYSAMVAHVGSINASNES